MKMTGAIFDFDGTLVDSMSMWSSVFPRVIAAHDMHMSDEEFDAWFNKVESLSVRDECKSLLEILDMNMTAEELYDEVCASVKHTYAEEISIFEGAKEFLDELKAAGVEMVVGSSSPHEIVAFALESFGLAAYFKGLVCSDDVGNRDKEFPDIYLKALEILGTAQESTWVFEDAPFGALTAKRAGFKVCALMNDHDGRDEARVRASSNLLSHGYGELSLARLEDYESEPREAELNDTPLKVLIVAGSPEKTSAARVGELAKSADYLIAADAGIESFMELKLSPHIYCGDADSSSAEAHAWGLSHAKTCIFYAKDKYETDLSLALEAARNEAARQLARAEITLASATGGRLDHELAVLGLLCENLELCPRLVSEHMEARLLSPKGRSSWIFSAEDEGKTLSAIALKDGTIASESGMKWDLTDAHFEALGDRGISNLIESGEARVSCSQGALLVCLFDKRG